MELNNIFKPIKATVKGFLGEVFVANMLSCSQRHTAQLKLTI